MVGGSLSITANLGRGDDLRLRCHRDMARALIKYAVQRSSWDANSASASQQIQAPYSIQIIFSVSKPTSPHLVTGQSNRRPPIRFNIHFNIVTHLCIRVESSLFPSGFYHKNLVYNSVSLAYVPEVSPISSLLINQIRFGQECKSQISSLCSIFQCPVTTYTLRNCMQQFFFGKVVVHLVKKLSTLCLS